MLTSKQKPELSQYLWHHQERQLNTGLLPNPCLTWHCPSGYCVTFQGLAGRHWQWGGLLPHKYLPLRVTGHTRSWSMPTFHEALFTERKQAPENSLSITNPLEALAVDQHGWECFTSFLSLTLLSTLGDSWRN